MHDGAVDHGVFGAYIGGEMLQERSTPPDVARREKRVVTEPLPPIKLGNASMTGGSLFTAP